MTNEEWITANVNNENPIKYRKKLIIQKKKMKKRI